LFVLAWAASGINDYWHWVSTNISIGYRQLSASGIVHRHRALAIGESIYGH
jgi:hypothetical protein